MFTSLTLPLVYCNIDKPRLPVLNQIAGNKKVIMRIQSATQQLGLIDTSPPKGETVAFGVASKNGK